MENAFREQYARKILPGLRGGLLLQLVIFLLQNASLFGGIRALSPPLAGVIILSALLLASLHPRFAQVWQPGIVATFCVLDYLMLLTGPHHVHSGLLPPSGGATQSDPLLLMELTLVIIGFVLTRLLFAWFALGCLAVAALQVFFAVAGGLDVCHLCAGAERARRVFGKPPAGAASCRRAAESGADRRDAVGP